MSLLPTVDRATYGRMASSIYLNLGTNIADDFNNQGMLTVVERINNIFFDGGIFARKSFASLRSIDIPVPGLLAWSAPSGHTASIVKKISWSAVLGYAESIPIIGSALAVILLIGHAFYMLNAYLTLNKTVTLLNSTSATHPCRPEHTDDVFNAAVSFTVHYNHFWGSMLSVIPLAKPLARLIQGSLYEKPAELPQEEPVSTPKIEIIPKTESAAFELNEESKRLFLNVVNSNVQISDTFNYLRNGAFDFFTVDRYPVDMELRGKTIHRGIVIGPTGARLPAELEAELTRLAGDLCVTVWRGLLDYEILKPETTPQAVGGN